MKTERRDRHVRRMWDWAVGKFKPSPLTIYSTCMVFIEFITDCVNFVPLVFFHIIIFLSVDTYLCQGDHLHRLTNTHIFYASTQN